MLNSDSYRELRNVKRYNTNPDSEMSDSGNVEVNRRSTSPENVEEEIPEIHTLTQEEVNQQIKGFTAPLTRLLEELTRLVQDMVTTSHPSPYPRADYSTTSGTATYQSDNK